MSSNNEVDIAAFKRAKKKSVNANSSEEQRRRRAYKKGFERGYETGASQSYKNGVKTGIIVGAIAAILVSGYIAVVSNSFSPDYVNDSYKYGVEAVTLETHRTNDYQNYWYDYSDIAESFDAETMDFDSFVYGAYTKVGWNEESRLACMDNLFAYFSRLGITNYLSFSSYCESKGFCKEKGGKLVVDTSAFEKAVEKYMTTLNELGAKENEVERFRNGL